ncbi:MAG: hypothetical protein ACYDAD_13845, partial [Acidimicrobiales bacterium]
MRRFALRTRILGALAALAGAGILGAPAVARTGPAGAPAGASAVAPALTPAPTPAVAPAPTPAPSPALAGGGELSVDASDKLGPLNRRLVGLGWHSDGPPLATVA